MREPGRSRQLPCPPAGRHSTITMWLAEAAATAMEAGLPELARAKPQPPDYCRAPGRKEEDSIYEIVCW